MCAKENAKQSTCLLRDFNISKPQKTQDIICTCKHATNTQVNLHKQEKCTGRKQGKLNRMQCFIVKDTRYSNRIQGEINKVHKNNQSESKEMLFS